MQRHAFIRSLLTALAFAASASCTHDYDRFAVGEGGGSTTGTGSSTTGAGASGSGGTTSQNTTQVSGAGGAGGTGGLGGSGSGGGLGTGGAGGDVGVGGGLVDGLVLDTHPAGQAADKFVLTPALPDAELFAFELSPTGSIDIGKIAIDLLGIQGLTTGDLSNTRLFRDMGIVGALDPSDIQVGATGTAMIAGTTGTVTFDLGTPLTLTAPQPMLFVADVASLEITDETSVSLSALSVAAFTTGTQTAVTPTGAVAEANHRVIAADFASGDALLYYGQGTVTTPFVRTYDDSSSTLSAPVAAAAAGATIRWVVTPDNYRTDEYVAVLSDDGSGTELDILHRATTTWAVDWTSTAIPSSDSRRRGFDIERESTSGDVVVVYSIDSGLPQFRTRSGGVWSAEAPILPATVAGTVAWMELVSRPGTNEITLLFTDEANDLSAVTWDGTAWSARTVLETGVNTIVHLGFAGAYESVSGDLVVAWGVQDSGVNGFHWARRAAGATSFAAPVGPEAAPLSRPGVMHMASEPGTDRIAIAYLELSCGGTGCDDFITAIWDGTTDAWIEKTRLDPDINADYTARTGSVPVEVAWLGTTGTAVAVYGDSGTNLDWATFTTGGGWSLESDFTPNPVLGQKVNFQMLSRPGSGEIVLLVADGNSDLFVKAYDGNVWTNRGAALETTLSTNGTGAFMARMKP